jgi:HSP20 family protein
MRFGALLPWREGSQVPAARDDFWDPMVAFRRDVDRMFDDFFNSFGERGLPAFGAGWRGITPAVDVEETDKEMVITAEMPGLEEKDFEVTVAGDVLTIKGEKKAEHEQKNGNGHYTERRYGAFARSVQLPFAVADEKVDAKYDRGVLTIRVPRPAEAQKPVRRIEVKGGKS